MAYSDDEDEEEIVPKYASNYHFEDDDKEPISFSVLRIQWNDKESTGGDNMDVFLRGTADDGLQILYKPVKAWRFDLFNAKPEILVLTKDNLWIRLEKPRKSFERVIRTVLITVHSLHYLRKNPDASGKSLWEHLSRIFGLYDVKPSQNDLIDHMDLIRETIKRDDCLTKSKFLLTFLEEKPTKKKLPDEDNPTASASRFIVDDMFEDVDDDDSNDEDYFESVCAICDNGGELLCCEGSCLRSFHPTEEDGEDSLCDSLGLTKREVDSIQQFLCKNCQYKRHQCFICKQLGSSDKSSGAEVFQCVSATCGYFYHPHCVASFLFKGNKTEAEVLEKKIASGESFTCPLHKCCVCKQGEVKTDPNLQFSVCRRCPKSYHWKCLPRDMAHKNIDDEDEKAGVTIRAWSGLLKNRVLLYCLDHEIDDELGTPARDHVKFPVTRVKKTILKEKRKIAEPSLVKEEAGLKRTNLALGHSHDRTTAIKSTRESSFKLKEGATIKRVEKVSSRVDTLMKDKETDTSRKSLMIQKKSRMMALDKARTASRNKASLGEKLFKYMQDPEQAKLRKMDSSVPELDSESDVVASEGLASEPFALDADSERRILALMREATSSITMEDIIKKHKVPSTHTSSIKHVVEKAITQGKVEGSVQAVRAALEKLVNGNNIEDAMAVCEPEVLSQIFKWKDKLKVYLAPFLFGPRYTSFGRHFTKVDKLQEIVDRLHCYAQDGDMIVDFCCGANDFSFLMKKKLEGTGKRCLFKNYDVLQAKNNFNFEKRDWMTVQKKELPSGSKLIMGLNPPFGVKASLANKFINKALEFEPKLLILIVPVETERLDKKKKPYELVWEDELFLSGKSFYLPGSLNDEHKQLEDWNIVSPPLSLWSRPDWADKHKEIAHKHDHLSMHQKNLHAIENEDEADVSTRDQNAGLVSTSMPMTGPDGSVADNSMLVDQDVSAKLDDPKDALEGDNGESQESQVGVRSQSNDLSRKRKIDEENKGRRVREQSLDSNLSKKSNNREKKSNSKDFSQTRRFRREEIPRGTRERSIDAQRATRPFRDEIYNNLEPLPSPSSSSIARRSHEPFGASAYAGNLDSFNDDLIGRYVAPLSQHFSTDRIDDYGTTYGADLDREADLRAQIRLYGHDPDVPGSSGLRQGGQRQGGHFDRGTSSASALYGNVASHTETFPYGMNRPAMQMQPSFVLPRRDETSYRRMNAFGAELPPPPSFVPAPQHFGSDPLHPRPLGDGVYDQFAPGPRHPNSYRHNTGWFNDE